jgi:hypothetical protein
LFLGWNKYRNLALQVGGVSKIEAIKYACRSRGKGCAGDSRQKLKTTKPISRQRGRPTSTNPQLSKNNQRGDEKNWSRVPDGCLTPGRTDRLTVGRNITLTLTSAQLEISSQLHLSPILPLKQPLCYPLQLNFSESRCDAMSERKVSGRTRKRTPVVKSAAFAFKAERYAKQYTALSKQHLETSACFMLVSCLVHSSIPRLEATCYSETSVKFRRAERRYIKDNMSSLIIWGTR